MLPRPVEVLSPQAGEMMLMPSRTSRSVLRGDFFWIAEFKQRGADIAHGVDGGKILLQPLQIDERIDADGVGVDLGQLIAAAAHVAANVDDDFFAACVNGIAKLVQIPHGEVLENARPQDFAGRGGIADGDHIGARVSHLAGVFDEKPRHIVGDAMSGLRPDPKLLQKSQRRHHRRRRC